MAKRRPRNDGDEDRDGPMRTCLVTRETGAREDLIRFVLSPEGEVTPDIRARLPGRGVWLTARRDVVDAGVRRRVFDRGFRQPARAPADLGATTDAMLERDALQMLAMANKAGLVAAGFGKVGDEIAGAAAGVVHAADAAPDGVRKLGQAIRRTGREIPIVNLFSSEQLGLALGRPNVIHAALAPGSAGAAFLARCDRLRRFRAKDAAASGEPCGASGEPLRASDRDGPLDDDTPNAGGQGPGSGADE